MLHQTLWLTLYELRLYKPRFRKSHHQKSERSNVQNMHVGHSSIHSGIASEVSYMLPNEKKSLGYYTSSSFRSLYRTYGSLRRNYIYIIHQIAYAIQVNMKALK